MVNESAEKAQKKKNKKGKGSKFICFDEEVVPKSIAEEILAQENLRNAQQQKNQESASPEVSVKRKKKKKKSELSGENDVNMSDKQQSNENTELKEHKSQELTNESGQEETIIHKKMKKRKKRDKADDKNEGIDQNNGEVDDEKKLSKKRKKNHLPESEPQETGEESASKSAEPKKKESIRERKRKKYAELIKDKKMKTELAMQQKSLNYLSKWKHSRNEWKFEKLRQIWLQQSIFDPDKIPQEFWETLVEYFSGSKGKIKDLILKDALKIIEGDNGEEEESNAKLLRARDVIQNLQE